MRIMLEQSIDKEFLDYFMRLSQPQKASLLSLIKTFVSKTSRITQETYNKEMDEAEARIAKGEYIEHENLEKEAEQW